MQTHEELEFIATSDASKASGNPEGALSNSCNVEHRSTKSSSSQESHPSAHRILSWKQRYLEGWRAGASASCVTATIILIINISITVGVAVHYQLVNGTGVLYQGNCSKAKSINTWMQLVINVLSTVLLSASNYCMQCLSSPTRNEVDKAHANEVLLDIGVPSIRNLFGISWDRLLLWFFLGLSALPLHFVYNSVVYVTTQANTYTVIAGTEEFLSGNGYSQDQVMGWVDTPGTNESLENFRQRILNSGRFERLSTRECLKAYSTQYVSARGNVFLVQDQVMYSTLSISGPYLSSPTDYPSYTWQCPWQSQADCNPYNKTQIKDMDLWSPFGEVVRYCWSELSKENCKLNFDLDFALIVMSCNLIKIICMFLTLRKHKRSALITIGDAIQSFLDCPDPTTKGLCTISTDRMVSLWEWRCTFAPELMLAKKRFLLDVECQKWTPKRRRWSSSVTGGRWYVCYILYLSSLGVALFYFFRCTSGMIRNISTFRRMGLGAPTGNNILSMNYSILTTVVIANSPQIVLSYLYVMFNALYTCMLAGDEWIRFASHRQTLRVTSPVGAQRSTYYLQLPYTYSIPLVVLSSLLSWLASQSLFMVQIDIMDESLIPASIPPTSMTNTISSCGFSPGAIILTVMVGSLIAFGAILTGLRRYSSGMPLAATCSGAISAACHRADDDVDASVLPLQWGVVSTKDGVGHCSFSSKLVGPLVPGRRYV